MPKGGRLCRMLPPESHSEYADRSDRQIQTDKQMPDCYITLSTMDVDSILTFNVKG